MNIRVSAFELYGLKMINGATVFDLGEIGSQRRKETKLLNNAHGFGGSDLITAE